MFHYNSPYFAGFVKDVPTETKVVGRVFGGFLLMLRRCCYSGRVCHQQGYPVFLGHLVAKFVIMCFMVSIVCFPFIVIDNKGRGCGCFMPKISCMNMATVQYSAVV